MFVRHKPPRRATNSLTRGLYFMGAGAERVHTEINCVVPGGKTREVADYFDFADFVVPS